MIPENRTVRVVVSDIDGTIFRLGVGCSKRVESAIQRMRQVGIPVILATGRSPLELSVLPSWLLEGQPVIAGGGAIIWSQYPHDVRGRLTFAPAHSKEIVTFLRSLRLQVKLLIEDDVARFSDEGYFMSGADPYGGETTYEVPLHHTLSSGVLKITARSYETDSYTLASCISSELGNSVVVSWASREPAIVEITSKGASKGAAAAALVEQAFGVPRGDVLAIGDMQNDHDLLSWAGTAVAMMGGDYSVIKIADVIAPSFDKDGAAVVFDSVVRQRKLIDGPGERCSL